MRSQWEAEHVLNRLLLKSARAWQIAHYWLRRTHHCTSHRTRKGAVVYGRVFLPWMSSIQIWRSSLKTGRCGRHWHAQSFLSATPAVPLLLPTHTSLEQDDPATQETRRFITTGGLPSRNNQRLASGSSDTQTKLFNKQFKRRIAGPEINT